ncbi:MAG: VWA domain-containing protein [Deltaproteobacteria bacterium]|jgi:uncharacterized protein YegL|nr:VWA domain-containing protein [Deltaproteobacteria bacterium]
MRRLPVYLLLDVSGSMLGDPIVSVDNGLQLVKSALRKDPQAMETAFVSLVTFASDVKQVIPLTEVASFNPPKLAASGGTSLGRALTVVTECAQREVNKGTQEEKGDWKPMVFIMTDGQPTDDIGPGLAKFKAHSWGTVVACAAGQHADTSVLAKITENVLVLDVADTTKISAFFRFVSASITTASKKVDSGSQLGSIDELPPPPPEISLLKM